MPAENKGQEGTHTVPGETERGLRQSSLSPLSDRNTTNVQITSGDNPVEGRVCQKLALYDPIWSKPIQELSATIAYTSTLYQVPLRGNPWTQWLTSTTLLSGES